MEEQKFQSLQPSGAQADSTNPQAQESKRKQDSRKLRSSNRVKKLSAAMRIVDEETRRIVMQNRIDALEADNLFDNNFMDQDAENEGLEDAADGKDGGYAGEYVVEQEEESEDILSDADASGEDKQKPQKATGSKAKRVEKGRKHIAQKQVPLKKGKKAKGGAGANAAIQSTDLVKQILAQHSQSSQQKSGVGSLLKRRRPKLDLQRLFYQDFHDVQIEEINAQNTFGDTRITNFSNYLSVAAQPSKVGSRRFFCSVCGYWSKYVCIRCGLRYCSLSCGETHKETRCIKFAD